MYCLLLLELTGTLQITAKDYSGFCVTTLGQIALQMLTASNHISSPFFLLRSFYFIHVKSFNTR